MASPFQIPRFQLPGAEYFSLTPNQHIAIQGMRRPSAGSASTSIPAGATQTITLSQQIENGWTRGSGIYIRFINCLYQPFDSSGELTISAIRFGVAQALNALDLDIGLPLITLLSPTSIMSCMQVQELFISASDLDISFGPFTGNLFFTLQVTLTNKDSTNAHNAAIFFKGMYARLDGMTE